MREGLIPAQQAQQRAAAQKDERDEALALDVLRVAVEHAKNAGVTDKDEVAAIAERFWQWVIS